MLPFWLNKGITKIELFAAHDGARPASGCCPDLARPGLSPPWRPCATWWPFAGAEPLATTRSLGAEVWAFGEQPTVFEGRGDNPPLHDRDLFTLLPFQVSGPASSWPPT